MSRVSGEKARAAIQKRNRTIRRAKDRTRLAEIKAGAGAPAAAGKTAKPAPSGAAKSRKPSRSSSE